MLGTDEEKIACICGVNKPVTGKFMLDCDNCHRWFHGTCVSIPNVESTPKTWCCDDCVIVSALKIQNHSLNKKGTEATEQVFQSLHAQILIFRTFFYIIPALVDAAGYKLLLPNGVSELENTIDKITPTNNRSTALSDDLDEVSATNTVYKQLILNYLSRRCESNDLLSK